MKLPTIGTKNEGGTLPPPMDEIIVDVPDIIKTLDIKEVGVQGMRIDREFFQKTEEAIKSDQDIKTAVDNEN